MGRKETPEGERKLGQKRTKVNFDYWWGVVILTTVGYGDIFPTTKAGRLVASILMFVGIGVVASLLLTLSPKPRIVDKLPVTVKSALNNMSTEEQMMFQEQYEKKSKSTGIMIFLAIFPPI